MSKGPLEKLAQLAGGVVLTRGGLGHQVLGQMLILDSTSIEVAVANTAILAVAARGSTILDAAVRTVAPALAVHFIARKEEERLAKLAEQAEPRSDDRDSCDDKLRRQMRSLRRVEGVQRTGAADAVRTAALQRENRRLRRELDELRRRLSEKEMTQASALPVSSADISTSRSTSAEAKSLDSESSRQPSGRKKKRRRKPKNE